MMLSFNHKGDNNPRMKEKRKYEHRETIIMPGIENGVIPSNILPKDMAGVMTKFYEKIFPPKKGQRLLHTGAIALPLLLCILLPFAALIFKIVGLVARSGGFLQ